MNKSNDQIIALTKLQIKNLEELYHKNKGTYNAVRLESLNSEIIGLKSRVLKLGGEIDV